MVDTEWVVEVEVWCHSELETGSADLKGVGTTTSPRMSAVCVAVPAALEQLLLQTQLSHLHSSPLLDTAWDLLPWQAHRAPVLLLDPLVALDPVDSAASNMVDLLVNTHYHQDLALLLVPILL